MTFSSVLVANRGEIARRIIRGARSFGLRTVAVYVDADRLALHVRDADEAVPLSTGYLDIDAILDAARRSGAQAMHPGYGYLAENADFARAVVDAGLVWIGPPPEAMAVLGDKLAAKRLAQACDVATLPSSDDPHDGDSVGYPLMVKAAGGGGGKGMRIVERREELDEAVAAARREAQSAFGDDRVFLERYVARAHHVEIQILGDAYGQIVHLGERECSVQRRHQKLIEESPSPIVDDAMRDAMGAAALALGRASGYESAGTVEFLVDDDTRAFYFLEVNTRLQVEHCVTEEVTGIDLVREQLRIASGEALGFTHDDVSFTGHAIEVRLCAEDPDNGFLPATGRLAAFELADEPQVRLESGVGPATQVTVAFDPRLAKVIAHAPTRREAAATLALALERLHIGGVMTNRDLLASTLRHEEFIRGATTTDFIDRVDPPRTCQLTDDELNWVGTAAALWLQHMNRAHAPVLDTIASGWRNSRLPRQHVRLNADGRDVDVHYARRRDGTFDVGATARARVHDVDAHHIDLEFDHRRRVTRISRRGTAIFVQHPRGTVTLNVVPRFVVAGADEVVGGLVAPMPGVVADVRVEVGAFVEAGATLVVMEAMKMEHLINAPASGTVAEVLVSVGQQVDRGAALIVIDALEG